MAHPQIAAFARLAEGSAKPTRSIAGQNTLITRTIHGMAYDPVHDEIVVPQFYAFAILTFRGDANGDVAPVRKIFGPSTQLKNPSSVVLDPVHGEIYVPQSGKFLIFPRDANGDVAPIRILETGGGLAVDPVDDLLIVSSGGGESGEGGGGRAAALKIFNRTASGKAEPLSVISGPRTMLLDAQQIGVDPARGLIFVLLHDGSRAQEDRYTTTDFVAVWGIHDKGDVPPRWTIGNGVLRDVRGMALNVKDKSVIVSDKNLNAVLTFQVPEIFRDL